jgi:hypothetical protein
MRIYIKSIHETRSPYKWAVYAGRVTAYFKDGSEAVDYAVRLAFNELLNASTPPHL